MYRFHGDIVIELENVLLYSIIVGRIIFSIVRGLGCVGGQSCVFVWRLLVIVRLVPALQAENARIRIGMRVRDDV